jgi:rubrerythrin
MNLTLNTEFSPEAPPVKTIGAQPATPVERSQPRALPFLAHLPKNACDVIGCKKYGHEFPSPDALAMHKHHAHRPPAPKAQPKSITMEQTETPPTAVEPPAKTYACKQCDAGGFTTPAAIARHVKDTHPKPKSAPHAPLEDPHQHLGDMPAQCPLCGAKGTRMWVALHFSKAHHGQILSLPTDPYRCKSCGFTSFSKEGVAKHCHVMHGTQKNLVEYRPPGAPVPPATPAKPTGLEVTYKITPCNRTLKLTLTQDDIARAAQLLISNGFTNLTIE